MKTLKEFVVIIILTAGFMSWVYLYAFLVPDSWINDTPAETFGYINSATLDERMDELITRQAALEEMVQGINRNLNNLGIHYEVVEKTD